MKTLRIFISSPSDVRPERVRAYDVITRLQTRYRAFLKLEPILWEDEAMRATASFQNQIVPPSSTDIVICILWAKIGTRLPRDYKRPDGSVPTGTEWEFEDAYRSFQVKGTPDLLVYRKTTPPTVTVTSDDFLRDWMQQKKRLDAFIDHWSRDHEGAFKAAFNSFKTDEEFEQKLEKHLEKVINAKLEGEGQTREDAEADAGIIWFEGSPYLGLNAFQPEHAKVFFGRDLAISEITERLLAQAARGRVFLMILGMSGCGKSSLARAGLLAELSRPAVIEKVGCWRWAILRPAEVKGTLIEGLAAALLGKKPALPELAALGFDAPKLAKLLGEAPTHALPLLEVALGQAAQQSAKEHLSAEVKPARFVLLVDQLEEIFTLQRFDAAQRTAFTAALSALSRGGLVWVITTMRSDLYYRCAEVTELVALKGEDGQYDLSPPSLSELGQMIRSPARAAGLKFERHPATRQKLDDALYEEAGKNPEALPLLEFCLDELYKLKTAANLITWAAYQELGGLKGAITKRAEEVYAGLSPAARDALPAVLGALIAMGKTATARPAFRKSLASHPGGEEVVAAYVAASLFVTDTNQTGEVIVTLAHEALISGWSRVQTWLHDNEDFLRVKARIAHAAQLWSEANRDRDFLLVEGKPLAEAEDALKKRRSELEPEEIEFVEISSRAAARARRLRRYKAAAILTVGLSLIFGTALLKARQAAAAARLATSQSDTSVAVKELQKNNVREALAYLADALRNDPGNEQAIALAVSVLRNCPLPVLNFQHKGEVQDVAFSPDGTRLATASADGTAQLWDTKTGQSIGSPMKHGNWVHAVNFNGDGSELVTSSWDHTASLWQGQGEKAGERIGEPMKHDDRVTFACFSPDKESKLLVTTCWNGEVRLWNGQNARPILDFVAPPPDKATARDGTGQPVMDLKAPPPVKAKAHEKTAWNADFSPDGARIVTASVDGTARVWEVATGKPARGPNGTELVLKHIDGQVVLPGEKTEKPPAEVNIAKFSPDGSLIAVASDDGQVWLWNAQTGKVMTNPDTGTKIILQHGDQVNRFGFSPDSRWIVTASLDKKARVWDVRTGLRIGAEMLHEGWVNSAVFSPDGRLVLTSSADGTVRVWDAESGEAIGHPMYHGSAVYLARFSPDGRRIAGASFDGTARLWSVQSGEPNKPMRHNIKIEQTGPNGKKEKIDQPAKIVAATINRDGDKILTVSEDGTAHLWTAPTDKSAGTPLDKTFNLRRAGTTDKSKVTYISFSPDGKTVATASTDGMVCLWEISSGTMLGEPFANDSAVQTVKFRQDGKYIVTGSDDGLARVWDVSTRQPVGKPMQHEGIVRSVCFSPDPEGKFILTASADHWARIWDAATHQPVGEPMRHENWVYDAEFSRDGRWIVTASADKTARLWEVSTGKPVGEPMWHADAVIAANFSPDGHWIATASWDQTARTWDARTGKPVGVSFPHGSKLTSSSFNPQSDKHWILTSTESGIARLWGFPITAPLAPDWLKDLVEDVGGLRLDEGRNLVLTPKTAVDYKEKYQHLPVSDTDELLKFAHWLVTPPAIRKISPLSETSVPKFVALQLKTPDELESLKTAYRADPGNPLVLTWLAKKVAKDDPETAKLYCKLALQTTRAGRNSQQTTDVEKLVRELFPDLPELNPAFGFH